MGTPKNAAWLLLAGIAPCLAAYPFLRALERILPKPPPHLVCWRIAPGLAALHFVGDLLIASAYFAIPVAIIYLMRAGRVGRSNLAFPGLWVWFAGFVLLCGLGHAMEALEIFVPIQWERGLEKLFTGLVSWRFLILLWRKRQPIITFWRALVRSEQEEEAA